MPIDENYVPSPSDHNKRLLDIILRTTHFSDFYIRVIVDSTKGISGPTVWLGWSNTGDKDYLAGNQISTGIWMEPEDVLELITVLEYGLKLLEAPSANS